MNKQVEERSDLTYRLYGLRRAQTALLLHCLGATQTNLKHRDTTRSRIQGGAAPRRNDSQRKWGYAPRMAFGPNLRLDLDVATAVSDVYERVGGQRKTLTPDDLALI